MSGRIVALMIAAFVAAAGVPRRASAEIALWHPLTGETRGRFERAVAAFNADRQGPRIVTTAMRGTADVVAGAAAASRNGRGPILVVSTEQGLPFLSALPGGIVPVHTILAESGVVLPDHDSAITARGAWSDAEGRLVGLPLTAQAPVMFFDRAAFAMAGLDAANPPRTWPDLAAAATAIRATNAAPCGFTSQWLSWIQVEAIATSHGADISGPADTADGGKPRLALRTPLLERHLGALRDWQAEKLFEYGGVRARADRLFREGRCAIQLAPSGLAPGLTRARPGGVGVAPLPVWPNEPGGPTRLGPTGGALYVIGGHKPAEYRVVARFLAHLAGAEAQARLLDETGYLPMSRAGLARLSAEGLATAASRAAFAAVAGEGRGPAPARLAVPMIEIVRDILEEELEQVFTGKKFVRDALEAAEKRGNEQIEQFEAAIGKKP